MAISQFPTPVPSTADPENFDPRADATLGHLPVFVDELNEFGSALNSLSTNSVSTTSLAISVAEKTLTVETGKSYFTGMSVRIARTSTGNQWMIGDVVSYNSTSGALVVDVQAVQGSGTYSSWSISLSFNGIVTPEQAPALATQVQMAAANAAILAALPIGWPFPIWTHIGAPAPDNSGEAKYILLTAGEDGVGDYNEGLLISETLSGSSPTIVATAVIDYAASPMDGENVDLINTSRKFIRPGQSGVTEESQNLSHTHTYSFRQTLNEASSSAPPGGGAGGNTGTTNSSGGNESRPRNIGANFYMRIA